MFIGPLFAHILAGIIRHKSATFGFDFGVVGKIKLNVEERHTFIATLNGEFAVR